MKVHKVILFIVDHDEVGAEDIKGILEETKYPNHCISPHIKSIETKDIGEFHDQHPLNLWDKCDAEYERLFGK